jgi:hypothetical protein
MSSGAQFGIFKKLFVKSPERPGSALAAAVRVARNI